MLLFARYGTSVAADTSILVDDESIAHRSFPLYQRVTIRSVVVQTTHDGVSASSDLPGQSRVRLSGTGDDSFSGHVEFNAAIAGAAFLCIVRRDRAGFSKTLRCHAVGADTLVDKGGLNRIRARQ